MFLETADIDSSTEDYATRFSGPVGEYFLNVQSEITLRCIGPGSSSILDVGGGHAQLAVPLVQKGFNVTITGSDPCCRNLLDHKLDAGTFTFEVCDMLSLPYDNDQFDFVLAFRLLPHVQRWEQLLGEMCRVARKGVIFDYPDSRSSNILYDVMFSLKKNYEKNTRTFTLFNRSQISSALVKKGFSTPVFNPQFLFPMVLHRSLKQVALSKTIETAGRLLFLTRFFGSPIIVKSSPKR